MMQIRFEQTADNAAIRTVHEAAFGQPAEADLVDCLRAACPEQISLVALSEDHQLIGHILLTPAKIHYTDDSKINGWGLAPLGVLPEFQKQRVGSELVQAGLQELQKRGQQFVIVLGHPEYYLRFGFEPAWIYGLSCDFTGENRDAFMIHFLGWDRFQEKPGRALYHPVFYSP
ncbi:N-acetyltransferase [Gimesia sp.]|uniref:GNAT family N-acetyltransferase n=1 Tax=Gimesia sp. TaxID=2024833 RepID=UPI000C51D061|nr:N-acetyltransferase [Gimesia sp.]MAX39723.1 GNAT family N-acetyltransferase [Gimesia sp.]HAH46314.1 N-acetyltransferase [Planctomycetaceae bacterium]HBL44001.1 N-acetyltransferase [Planctomycetaceae bacterium]|tara:strand:- start:8565 stop:9083 length:519 start_codon:yes stop_codon:yes gene_type:complete